MTTNFDVRVLKKYAIGFLAGLLLFWIVQQLFFKKDKNEPVGRNYKKEYEQSQSAITRLRKDSMEQRQILHKEIAESEDENQELKFKLGKLERHYEKLDFKTHTFDELDNMRDRVLSDLHKE